jgi:hypothetical protein
MNVVALAAGQSHSLALRNDGTVVAWGRNHHGQTNVPAGLSGVAAIAAGANHSLARQSNGTVVVWGQNNEGQVDVPARLVAGAIAASGSRSLAVRLKQFRIVSITPRVSGGWQLGIGHSDGSTVTSQQLNNIEVRTTTDITQPVINWTRLTSSLSLQNGVARIDDPRSDLVQRFYLVIER